LEEGVVVADAGEEEAARFEAGMDDAEGPGELRGGEVGKGVIEGGDGVVGGGWDASQGGHVGGVEVDVQVARKCFAFCALYGGGAEVGGGGPARAKAMDWVPMPQAQSRMVWGAAGRRRLRARDWRSMEACQSSKRRW
jgi:hypothetical protein